MSFWKSRETLEVSSKNLKVWDPNDEENELLVLAFSDFELEESNVSSEILRLEMLASICYVFIILSYAI